MKKLSIDLETYSSVDLGKSGVYKYAESEDFEILLFAYSIDDGGVKVIDLASGESVPEEILSALSDESIEKWAFNANFERVCLSRLLGERLKPQGWYCTMIWSAYLGLPLSLEKVGEVLKLDKQKMNEGKALIRYFSIPCKPTKTNGMRTRNLPHHDLEKWSTFKEYNQRDVETEMAIKKKLSAFPMPQSEWENYWIDQNINDRGILIDEVLVDSAIKFDQILRDENMDRAIELTGLENPNSPLQLKEWLNKKGLEIDSLAKKDVESALKSAEGDIKEVLELRQELSKSSVRKYDAMKNVKGKDNRARGLIQFYGANRTGRYSGRLIQVQNLRRNNLKDLELARSLVKNRDYETMEMLYESPSDVLSQLIRTAFIAKEGTRFIISDFSAIEARVLAWLAGEQWVLDAFENGEDIYCRTASRMFGVPVEKHGINGHLRQKGKIATLACGYQGALGALKAMGGIEMGLSEDELQSIVDSWREANPNIVSLWWDIDAVVKRVVKTRIK
ncbi:MAG: DNA polymerase, partial [Peptoniphilus harei]|uniref:DNA polymerase n=1 Tax=Peptoniphilus harei TaxID=54005 RepID=UPI0029050835